MLLGGIGGKQSERVEAGCVREAGEEGAGSGRKRGKLGNIAQYFTIEKNKKAGANKYRAGTGIKGYGKREVLTPPCPPRLCFSKQNCSQRQLPAVESKHFKKTFLRVNNFHDLFRLIRFCGIVKTSAN